MGALHQTRMSNLQSKGIERKANMESYDKESEEGGQDLIDGEFEHVLDTASKVAGLTSKQYGEWR